MVTILDNAFKLTIDQIFPPKHKIEKLSVAYKVDGYSDQENMWEYLTQIGTVKVITDYKTATSNLYKTNKRSSLISQVENSNGIGIKERIKNIIKTEEENLNENDVEEESEDYKSDDEESED